MPLYALPSQNPESPKVEIHGATDGGAADGGANDGGANDGGANEFQVQALEGSTLSLQVQSTDQLCPPIPQFGGGIPDGQSKMKNIRRCTLPWRWDLISFKQNKFRGERCQKRLETFLLQQSIGS